MPAPSTKTSFDISYPFIILAITIISIFALITQSAITAILARSNWAKTALDLVKCCKIGFIDQIHSDTDPII
ncbi:hypothetical protein C9426_20295 [Serratia sp. S1B]|nr:hypothetical protein C9426_20295 [Serratia sp. S1B]